MFIVLPTTPASSQGVVYYAPNAHPSAASQFIRLLCEERLPISASQILGLLTPNACPSAISHFFHLLALVYCSPTLRPCGCFTVPSFFVLLPLSHVLRQLRSLFFLSVVWVFKSSEFDSLNALVPIVCSIFLRDEFPCIVGGTCGVNWGPRSKLKLEGSLPTISEFRNQLPEPLLPALIHRQPLYTYPPAQTRYYISLLICIRQFVLMGCWLAVCSIVGLDICVVIFECDGLGIFAERVVNVRPPCPLIMFRG
ncbi:hypothetical protein TIFTF001_009740 [Ficus carica]|uniref:Uncharacterized protein n=1 Tax=Ficus carica TaxID=3494 RepID=A0AA88AAY7_FICCA|nr:hypothetical protein TIFTF001_009740 [Ficus carica]